MLDTLAGFAPGSGTPEGESPEMIDTPQIVETHAQPAAIIRLTIPRSKIREVMGPGLAELKAAIAAQGIAITGPWFTHHLKMEPDVFDFEIGVPVATQVTATGRVQPGELPAARVAQTVYHGGYEGLSDGWSELMDSNLKAPLFLSQAAAPYLKKSHGAIVNIVDIHAERPLKDFVVYTIAKAGLAGLTRSLALELGPEIRVNGVSPGAILWPDSGTAFPEAEQARIIAQTPLRQIGKPQDIAGAVKYLMLDAPFVSGQILAVDGGRGLVV